LIFITVELKEFVVVTIRFIMLWLFVLVKAARKLPILARVTACEPVDYSIPAPGTVLKTTILVVFLFVNN